MVSRKGCRAAAVRGARPATVSDMDLDRIGPLLDRMLGLMRDHELVDLELESEGLRIRARKGTPAGGSGGAETAPAAAGPADGREPVPTPVDAPVVGTFYRASTPDAAPFVEVGDRVEPGDVLCVIEAMKLMNDIQSEFAGEVVEVLAENGQAVEYGQPLFTILPASGG